MKKGLLLLFVLFFIGGCAMPGTMHDRRAGAAGPPPGTIVDTRLGREITFDQFIEALRRVNVVYLGERHTDPWHHRAQLKVIEALTEKNETLSVGMEMFAHTYQTKLDRWSAGGYEWPEFLKQVHWYANWKFDDNLYKDILLYIQDKRIPLIGLNIPFHLPPKIAIGGLASLSEAERAQLPERIDTTNTAHRAYLEAIFSMHQNMPGRDDFESFYAAQCAWEDGMAQAVATHTQSGRIMVVLAGNGHIVNKFGIPDRALDRNPQPFLTVYMTAPGEQTPAGSADFIWTGESSPD